MSELEPFEPVHVVRMYLGARQDELVDRALKSHRYQLRAFVERCEESGVDDPTGLDGRDLYESRVWRREGNFGVENDEIPGRIMPVTLKSQLATFRALPRFTANIHTVPEDFYERVSLPKLSETGGVSDSTFGPDRATNIFEYPHRYHYVSRRHIEFALLRETDARVGAIRGPDPHDLDLDDRIPVVRYEHQLDQDVPIKNDEKGEQFNSVSDWVGTMLQAYIDGPCVDEADELGRKPLLTTSRGRVSVSTIRQDVYVVIRPYWLNQGYPHNRDIKTCGAVELNHVSTYPSSRFSRDVRKGVVTLYRREEVPHRAVSDRLDASDLVLDKHYDCRGGRERAE